MIYTWEDQADGWRFDFWSDSFDIYFSSFGPKPGQSLQQCFQSCDGDLTNGQSMCIMGVGALALGGLAITTGATLFTLVAGPVAGVTFAGGLAITADVTAVAGATCAAAIYAQWAYCKHRCSN